MDKSCDKTRRFEDALLLHALIDIASCVRFVIARMAHRRLAADDGAWGDGV